ncbi:MAG: hypothetical protein LBN93_11005 [Candidatus Symbiothrix sp.]|jgi:hypothetical protein|nr:hypothetical protein [Candidatus Symbiothrix sp.]
MAKRPMSKGTHGTRGESFEELSFDRQAKSINGTIQTLKKEIDAHTNVAITNMKNPIEVKQTCIMQVIRMLSRL